MLVNEWRFVRVRVTRVRVARPRKARPLYFLLIDNMLISYLFKEKLFLSVYLCNIAW